MIFGAGHVGSAIAAKLPGLPFDLAWFDSRAEFDMPGLVIASEDALVACAATPPAGSAVLILTHDHALDYRLTAAALAGPAGFVGLIGSRTKRSRFLSRLAGDGIDASRLTSPIGLPGILGKEPATIAIAVLAQLLALRDAD
jgi:xanthine dehydrogenase accessory factor